MENSNSEFGKIRSIIWPIHNHELKKFIPMSFLMFVNLFVYTITCNLKDIFVFNYATLGGIELVAPLKGILVLPTTVVIAMLFSLLVGKFGIHKTFYIVISFFTLFFLLFAFILFPNTSKIHWDANTMLNFRNSLPRFLYYVIPCIGNWSYSLFFILAETWGVLAIHSLFWNFSNRITKKTEMNRFYALYHLIGCLGRLLAGKLTEKISKVKGNLSEFNKNVIILITVTSLACVISMIIYYYLNKVFSVSDEETTKKILEKRKSKVRFLDGIKILFSSKYLLLIFILPVSYGVGMNLYEGIFKGYMRNMAHTPIEMSKMIGQLSQMTAIFTFVLTFVGTFILRRFSWKFASLVTPTVLFSLGTVFFILIFYQNANNSQNFGISISSLALVLGMIIDSLTKGTKYCLFDPTKGMAYRTLDEETQSQGQGAVEIVGGRGGKGLGAIITMTFTSVLFPGSKVLDHIYSFFMLFTATLILWIFACNKLGNLYEEKNN